MIWYNSSNRNFACLLFNSECRIIKNNTYNATEWCFNGNISVYNIKRKFNNKKNNRYCFCDNICYNVNVINKGGKDV